MSTGDHMRAAAYNARGYADWKRAEAGANFAMRANEEHARAMGAGMMGNPSSAHAHEMRAQLAAAAADTVRSHTPPLMNPPHVMAPQVHRREGVEVLPPRVIVEDGDGYGIDGLRSPLTDEPIFVDEPRSPPMHVAPPVVPVRGVPLAPAPIAAPYAPAYPRVRARDALREVVSNKLRHGEHFMARKAYEQHTMAGYSGAMGLPQKAHQHETKAQLAGALSTALHRPSRHSPVVVPPSPIIAHDPIPSPRDRAHRHEYVSSGI